MPIRYGRVTGRFVSLVGADDAGVPVEVPMTGTVTLSPRVSSVAAPADAVTAVAQTIYCQVVDGVLCGPDGVQGVTVAASAQPDGQPSLVQWQAVYAFGDAASAPVVFEVPEGDAVDLSVVVPSTPAAGTVTVVSHADAVAAAASAASAAEAYAAVSAAVSGLVRGSVRDPGGAFTTGNVVLIGDHAYAVGGIATAAVLGGAANYENVIGGNLNNVDTPASNLDGAAALTGENGNWNFLLGGYDTVVNGWACAVTGFHCKVGLDANHVTIGGGSRHVVAEGAAYGTIGGGTLNEVSGNESTVAGGRSNKATANTALVSGGANNTASASAAVVSGGTSNTASNANATIVGGNSNTASGNSSTVGGGLTNTASATAATIPGGRDNTASGTNSLATGRGAVALENGQHAHAAVPFSTPGDAQINRWSLKKQTTDATAGNLEADTGAPPVIPENTTWAFSALVVARRADVDGENAAYEVRGCFKRDAGNTAALVGTPTVTALGASAGAAAWTVTVAAYSVGTLRLIVTGEAGKTIRWVAELRAAQAAG